MTRLLGLVWELGGWVGCLKPFQFDSFAGTSCFETMKPSDFSSTSLAKTRCSQGLPETVKWFIFKGLLQ